MLKKTVVFLIAIMMVFPSSLVPSEALAPTNETPFKISETAVSTEQSWEDLGESGLLPQDPYFSMDVWDNKMSVAASDKTNGGKATVYQYDGSGWAAIGNLGFSQGVARGIQIDVYEGVYYAAFSDGGFGCKPTVMKYDGLAEGQWVNVGDRGFGRYPASVLSLQIYDGTPYLAYASDKEIALMKFNGASWEQMASLVRQGDIRINSIKLSMDEGVPNIAWKQVEEGVYKDVAFIATYRDNQLDIHGNGPGDGPVTNSLYWFDFYVEDGISYFAQTKSSGALVFKFDETYAMPHEVAGENATVCSNYTLCPDGGDLYLAFNGASGVQVKKRSGNSWNSVAADFPDAGNNFIMKVEDGTPYIAYLVDGKISAVKYGTHYTGTLASGKIELILNKSIMKVNGLEQEIDPGRGTKSEAKDGTTFLPLRSIIEAMGGSIDWNSAEKKVSVECNGATLEFGIGSTKAEVNGVEKTMDEAPYTSKSGRTMMPLRFVAENLGCQVGWDGDTKTVTIQYEETESTGAEEIEQSNLASWTGVWDSLYGTMLLTQSGDKVTGVYEADDFAIEGTVNGSTLTGTFQEFEDKGSFEFVLSPDGTFQGERRYQGSDESSEWTGSFITGSFGSEGTSWGGVWYTEYGPLIVTQNNNYFTGIYMGTNKYTMEGTVSGGTVTGRIQEVDTQGDMVLTIADNGKSFTGKWRYDGEEEWSEWSGIKKR